MLTRAAQSLRHLLTTERAVLLAILLFSFYFRVIQLDTSFFGPEQAWIAHDGYEIATLQAFPTFMNKSSAGYHNFPLTHYLAAIPFIFMDDIYALSFFFIMWNLVTIWLCWQFTRRYWGWQTAALATMIFICMPYAVLFSYRIWNNTLMPPFVMLWALGCALAFQEKRPRWLMLAWGAAWLSIQLHISGILLLVTLFPMMWVVRLPRAWRYAFLGSALAMLFALPWFYAQVSGVAQLGLDFSTTAGRAGLKFNFSRITQFLGAGDLAWNFISAGREDLARQLAYMRYLAPIWLLLFGAALLVCVWQVWRKRTKQRALFFFLSLWCVLPLGFTVVSNDTYTIVYYLPMLPAPCIVLALALKKAIGWRRRLKTPLVMGVLGLCALNLNAVWSIHHFISDDIKRGEPTTHAFSLDSWYYSAPLVWQLGIVEEILALLDAGDASELIMIQYTLPDESDRHLRRPFSYHLRGYEVRVVNIYRPNLVYPERAALFLRDKTDVARNGGYVGLLKFQVSVGPYRLYLLSGNAGPAPQFLLPERPTYENGLRLLGYDALRCDGNWQLHWTPGPPNNDGEPVHFFIHLLDPEGVGLAHSDLRAYDIGDWRAGDHIITTFDFGQELRSLPAETIRVGLYRYSDETKSFQEGIYALDEQGRPWEYAVDIPFAGECAA